MQGVKTAYGELEGSWDKFGVGVYYNNFDNTQNSADDGVVTADDLWGAYAKFNFGKDWTLLGNYEK